MERLTKAVLPSLVLASGCIVGGPDAREIATEEASRIIASIGRECNVGLKMALGKNSLTADSNSIDATVRYTLDATTGAQEDCIAGVVTSHHPSRALVGGCDIGFSYPKGWTEIDGGMRMGVIVDCLPHLLGENE